MSFLTAGPTAARIGLSVMGRVERALLYLRVHPLPEQGAYRVEGGEEQHYVHTSDPTVQQCDCPDHEWRDRTCAHAVAALYEDGTPLKMIEDRLYAEEWAKVCDGCQEALAAHCTTHTPRCCPGTCTPEARGRRSFRPTRWARPARGESPAPLTHRIGGRQGVGPVAGGPPPRVTHDPGAFEHWPPEKRFPPDLPRRP